MTRGTRIVVAALVAAAPFTFLSGCSAPRASAELTPARLAVRAQGSEGSTRDSAIRQLRAMGPSGLQALIDAAPQREAIEQAPRFLDAVDRVAAQRDAITSRLFWYTDLEAAKAEAARSGRPILSLRLLGRLDEELSCANSRFFRTVLYANDNISKELRSRYVLHWESVRPVPKLTIDFGDGRTLVTTITGNSIHYVLLADGRPIDAMPGLWGSQAFLSELERADALAAELQALAAPLREERLKAWHAERLAQLAAEARRDAASLPPAEREELLRHVAEAGSVDFGVLDDIVFSTGSFTSFPEGSKRLIEFPVVRALVPDAKGMDGELGKEVWSALARLHAGECRLDEGSREMARRKELGLTALGFDLPRGVSRNLEPMFESLQRSVAEDTVRNRYMTGARLHEWFASGKAPADVKELNDRVYRELFMSPVNDTWLGLVPPDMYGGLDRGGKTGSDS